MLGLVLAPLTLRAQWQASADFGASHLQRTDIPQSGAVTVGGSVTGIGDRGWFRSSLLGVVAGADRVTLQGLMGGSVTGSPDRAVRAELNAVMSAFGESGRTATLSGEVMPRVQLGSATRGGALGVGLGTTAREGVRNALYHAAADGWWAIEDHQFAASVSGVRTRVTVRSAPTVVTLARSYADFIAGWRHDRGGIVLGASAGVRNGFSYGGGGAWGSAEAALWVFPRTALVFSGGRTLDDPVRGIPRTTFLGVALRVTGQAHRTLGRTTAVQGARLVIERLDASRRRIVIRGVTGARVEVMGDFTDWSPVALEAVDGAWRVERDITPGLHRIALRVDGGEWTAPVNLPRATDDLGGVVGLVTVP